VQEKKQMILVIVLCVSLVAAGGLFWFSYGGRSQLDLSTEQSAEKVNLRQNDSSKAQAGKKKSDPRSEREKADPGKAIIAPGEEDRPAAKRTVETRPIEKIRKKDKPTAPAM